jgi:hypothetical protein
MEQKILLPRTSSPWTETSAVGIYHSILRDTVQQVYSKEIAIGILSPSMHKYIVGKYGWLCNPYASETERLEECHRNESILQSGKVGKWYGQGPWTRSLACRIPRKYEGRYVHQIKFEFTKEFAEELRTDEGIHRKEDVVVLLINSDESTAIELIPVQFASLYCPDWDDNHPTVLAWLKEWKEAVKIENATGCNPMLDEYFY